MPKQLKAMKKEVEKKKCIECKKELPLAQYYSSTNPMFGGKTPMCKNCIKEKIDYSNIKSIHSILQSMDIPFLYDVWEVCLGKNGDTFGNYVRMMNSLPQYKGMRWSQSIFEKSTNQNTNAGSGNEDVDNEIKSIFNDFKLTKEIVMRWGSNYNTEQYMKLEKFYHDMKEMNKIETPQEEDYLKKLSVISMKMDEELENGNYSQVKQLGDLFSKYMADSKFRAMDRTDADKSNGIRTFSQIFQEVRKDGFIPPWEQYRKVNGLKQDVLDKTIMYILNYILRLNKAEIMAEPPIDTPMAEDDELDITIMDYGDDSDV